MIRKLNYQRDYLDLLKLFEAFCAESGNVYDAPTLTHYLNKCLTVPGYQMFVLDEDGGAKGFVDTFPTVTSTNIGRIAVCQWFYVDPKYRHKSGLLYRKIISYIKDMGIKKIQISCKRSMVEFWNKHGFVETVCEMHKEV